MQSKALSTYIFMFWHYLIDHQGKNVYNGERRERASKEREKSQKVRGHIYVEERRSLSESRRSKLREKVNNKRWLKASGRAKSKKVSGGQQETAKNIFWLPVYTLYKLKYSWALTREGS